MRKRHYLIPAIVLVTAMNFTACSFHQNGQNSVEVDKNTANIGEKPDEVEKLEPVYTNLGDKVTQDEIENQLIAVGIKKETANEFLEWVKDYNASIISQISPIAGYEKIGENPLDYSQFIVKEEYREDGSIVSGMNCRLTAYLLMNQFIDTKQKFTSYDPYLMFDVECIDMDKKFETFDREKFITLMEPVEVEKDSNLQEHINAIATAWEERGITIQENGKLSLITMYLHDNYENKRFVGHAGVLLNTEEGYLFIEKYGWNEPFQATKFGSEREMVDYLLSRPDLIGDGSEEPVIVMKNDTVIS